MRFRTPIRRSIVSSIVFLLTACASAPVHEAQDPVAPLSAGDLLRVTHTSSCCTNPSIGIGRSVGNDTLVMQPQTGQPFAIPRSSITRIDRWNRGQTHKAADAGLGLLIGAVSGGFAGYSSGCDHCDGDMRPLSAMVGVIFGGTGGLLAGLLVGAYRLGFWEAVP